MVRAIAGDEHGPGRKDRALARDLQLSLTDVGAGEHHGGTLSGGFAGGFQSLCDLRPCRVRRTALLRAYRAGLLLRGAKTLDSVRSDGWLSLGNALRGLSVCDFVRHSL